METPLEPFTVTVDGSTVRAADLAGAVALLHDAMAARTTERSSQPVRWRIDGPAGPVLWGQVALPEPDPGWLRWWMEGISAALRPCAGPDGPVR